MTFQYKIFPELRLKHGVEKTINDPIAITTNGNREIRRKINKTERYSWTIPARHLLQADMQAVVDFSRVVVSSLDSFLYRDPTMPELINQPLTRMFASGLNYFGLYHSGTHPILNMLAGGNIPQFDLFNDAVVIKRNGVVVDKNEINLLYNKDPSTLGRPDLPRTTVISSNWAANDVITYTGPIYHTVRFDSMISYRIAALKKSTVVSGSCEVVPIVSEMADIKLIEVFEYAEAT